MFMKGILCVAGHELQHSERREPLSKTSSHRCDAWIVRPMIDEFMKFIIKAGEVLLAIRNPFLAAVVQNFEPLFLKRCHSYRT